MDQLDNLLEHLDIHDNFDLLGPSWGGEFENGHVNFRCLIQICLGFLAGFYAATRPHKGLQNLIVSNAYASIELLEEGLNLHLDKILKDFAEMIRKHELNKHHGRTRVPERHGDIRHETLVYIAAAAEGFGAVV
jgi:L-proline amide hydrolase